MGLVDAFNKEDRTELTVSQLITLLNDNAKLKAENELMVRGYQNRVPYGMAMAMLGIDKKEVNE